MGRRTLRGILWVGLLLSLAVDASAQARQTPHRNPYGRRHRAPRRTSAPRPEPAGPWNAARSRFILSAESLLGFSYFRESARLASDGGHTESVQSGTGFHLFKGADLTEPYAAARLGLDLVVGPGLTLGGSIGYSSADGDKTTTFNDEALGSSSTTEPTVKLRLFLIHPRIGYVLAPSRYLAVWLRAGVAYASLNVSLEDEDTTQSSLAIKLDPMLVVTPLPHVGLLIGPDLNIGVSGSVTGNENGRKLPDLDHRASAYGVNAGIALMF